MTADAQGAAGPGPHPGALKRYLVGQFARPRGPMGWLAGRIMAGRGSNRQRNRWTVGLMDIAPDHRVLEIGFGPGLALADICARLDSGHAVGIDHSETMRRMAAARNRAAVAAGRLTLLPGSVEAPGGLDGVARAGPFDRIFAVNVAQFWREPEAVLRRLAGWLAPGGAVYLTFQPRSGDVSDAAALAFAARMEARMQGAGLTRVRVERLAELSPMAVCVIGSPGA